MNLAISSSFLLSYPDSSLAHPHFYLSLVGLPKSKTESLDRTFGSNFIGTKVKLQAASPTCVNAVLTVPFKKWF
jgi:hypothetical protein